MATFASPSSVSSLSAHLPPPCPAHQYPTVDHSLPLALKSRPIDSIPVEDTFTLPKPPPARSHRHHPAPSSALPSPPRLTRSTRPATWIPSVLLPPTSVSCQQQSQQRHRAPHPLRAVTMSNPSSPLLDFQVGHYRRDTGESTASDATYHGPDAFAFPIEDRFDQLHSSPFDGSYSDSPTLCDTVQKVPFSPAYNCTMCGWSTSSGDHFDYHLRAHDGDCLFQCFVEGCEAAFAHADELVGHSSRHSSYPVGFKSGAGVKRSWDEEDQYEQWPGTPSRTLKRVCVEPITPITPSTTYNLYAGSQSAPARPSSVGVSRTLSYDAPVQHMPPFLRHNSYDGIASSQRGTFARDVDYSTEGLALPQDAPSSSVTQTFTIPSTPTSSSSYTTYPPQASPSCLEGPSTVPRSRQPRALLDSPHNITSSAPLDRGRFQPYPDVTSASMVISQSLPQTHEHCQTPSRLRTRKLEDEFDQFSPPVTHISGPQVQQQYCSPSQLHSPVSPEHITGPVLVSIPAPVVMQGATSPSSRRSSTSSNYTPQQQALVSAASMNRLLARLPTSPRSYSPPAGEPVSPPAPSLFDLPDQPTVSAIHPRYREPAPVSPAQMSAVKQQEKTHFCAAAGCGKSFKRLEHLRRHERTHTLEKPYGCDVPGCGRFFSRSDNLAQHRKTHEKNGKTTRAMQARAAAAAAVASMTNNSVVWSN
ncbi:hypothetical protein JCM11641_007093 [Rhodosporidiobolus odoratus]